MAVRRILLICVLVLYSTKTSNADECNCKDVLIKERFKLKSNAEFESHLGTMLTNDYENFVTKYSKAEGDSGAIYGAIAGWLNGSKQDQKAEYERLRTIFKSTSKTKESMTLEIASDHVPDKAWDSYKHCLSACAYGVMVKLTPVNGSGGEVLLQTEYRRRETWSSTAKFTMTCAGGTITHKEVPKELKAGIPMTFHIKRHLNGEKGHPELIAILDTDQGSYADRLPEVLDCVPKSDTSWARFEGKSIEKVPDGFAVTIEVSRPRPVNDPKEKDPKKDFNQVTIYATQCSLLIDGKSINGDKIEAQGPCEYDDNDRTYGRLRFFDGPNTFTLHFPALTTKARDAGVVVRFYEGISGEGSTQYNRVEAPLGCMKVVD